MSSEDRPAASPYDNVEIPLVCEKCGHRANEKFSRLTAYNQVLCRKCGHPFKYDELYELFVKAVRDYINRLNS